MDFWRICFFQWLLFFSAYKARVYSAWWARLWNVIVPSIDNNTVMIISQRSPYGMWSFKSSFASLQRALQSSGVGDDVRHVPDRSGCDRLHLRVLQPCGLQPQPPERQEWVMGLGCLSVPVWWTVFMLSPHGSNGQTLNTLLESAYKNLKSK